jgi:hypothetical protein
MNVDRVPVSEALETLTTVAEARWRLAYVFAGNMTDIQVALAATLAGNHPENWKTDYFPAFGMTDGQTLGNPSDDPWQVKAPEKNDFQSYVHQAALSVSAAMMYPEAWNPAVNKAPSSGPIRNSAPQLAKAAGGKVLEVFLVQKRPAQQVAEGDDANADPQSGFRRGRRGGNNTPEDDAEREKRRQEMAQRAQAEIDKLPPEKRAAAQQQMDERRKFFESMRDLTPEQRRDKMADFMSNDANQNRMEQRGNDRQARMTPDQRVQRAQHYVERKQAAMANMGK